MSVKLDANDTAPKATSFAGYVFDGDRTLAARYIPTAQNLLFQLRMFVEHSGTTVFALTRKIEGGFIRASTNMGIEKVYINVVGGKPDENDVDYVEILSGVTKGGEIVTITPPVVGAAQFKTLRSYRPTLQAYDYPLKKRPGNYPETLILPGTTFEDQPRLAVPAYAPVLNLPGYFYSDYGNSGNPIPWTYSGNLGNALQQVPVVNSTIADLNTLIQMTGNENSAKIASRVTKTQFGYVYVRGVGYSNTDRQFNVYIFAEGTPTTSGTASRAGDHFKALYGIAQFNFYADSSARSQSAEINASMYSGYLAKAVQVILGYGKLKSERASEPNKLIGVQVKYDWRWARCHGIVVAADGALWLVEISINNGVIAMPLPLFTNTVKGTPLYSQLLGSKQDVLREAVKLFGGLPSGETFPTNLVPSGSPSGTLSLLDQAIAKGDVIRLASVSSMAPYFEKSPHSSWMGWSFNEGSKTIASEAHNTCYEPGLSVPGTPYVVDDIAQGFHFKLSISIAESVKNRSENQPIALGSAVLSVVDSGPISSYVRTYDGSIFGHVLTAFTEIGATTAEPSETTIFVCHLNNQVHKVWSEHHHYNQNTPSYIHGFASYAKSTECNLVDVAFLYNQTAYNPQSQLPRYTTDTVVNCGGFVRDGYEIELNKWAFHPIVGALQTQFKIVNNHLLGNYLTTQAIERVYSSTFAGGNGAWYRAEEWAFISDCRFSVFGEHPSGAYRVLNFNIHNDWVGSTQLGFLETTLTDKTVCIGPLLATESNTTKVNYSFIGYI